jgi:flagellar hook protein FlgE
VFYAPFTFVVDEAGTVTGEGEAEDSFSDGQDTVTLQFTMGLEGTVDEDGDLALTAHIVFSATSTSGEEGYEEGDFSFSWKIDENGHLSGTAVWQEGQEWPVTGGAVSGGPAGLP